MMPFKNCVTCIMAVFIPFSCVRFCQFYSAILAVLLNKNKLWNQRKFFVYMAALVYHVISKELENRILKHNCIFRHNCIYKQPRWSKQWNYVFVQYIVISDTPISSWMCFSCCFRSSGSQMLFEIGVIKKFSNFTGKHLC